MIENIGAYSQADYDRGYQQGRADAIEECLKIAKYTATMWDEAIWVVRDIEQLKEQANE